MATKEGDGIKHILLAHGTYAPPHKGHLNAWKKAVNAYYDFLKESNADLKKKDVLLFIDPVGQWYSDSKEHLKMFTRQHRQNLIKILLTSDKEINEYSIDVANQLGDDILVDIENIKNTFPDIKPAIFFGADNIFGTLGPKDPPPGVYSWRKDDDYKKTLYDGTVFVVACGPIGTQRGSCQSVEFIYNREMERLEITTGKLIKVHLTGIKIEKSSTEFRKLFGQMLTLLTPEQIEYILSNRILTGGRRKTRKRRKRRKKKKKTKKRKRKKRKKKKKENKKTTIEL